jgi:membrane-bound inhibitor of C-type lysozyme
VQEAQEAQAGGVGEEEEVQQKEEEALGEGEEMGLTAQRVNEQAMSVASTVLNDSVVVAAHMEQVTQDQ